MKETQIIKRKKFIILMTAVRRQNLSEKKILLLYSAEKRGNQNITYYQKCANPVYQALYGQAVKLRQTFSTY
jgi:hypothetical protein